jgi:two-component system, NarL family, response regulator LiaR
MKNTTGKELISAIRNAAKGHSSLSSEASDMLISGYKTPDYRLTSREKDILTLMVKGQSNNEIAGTLTISPSTVKFHVSNILMKMGVSSRNKAVSLAVENKLVKDDEKIM